MSKLFNLAFRSSLSSCNSVRGLSFSYTKKSEILLFNKRPVLCCTKFIEHHKNTMDKQPSMSEIRRLLLTGDVDNSGSIDLQLNNDTGIGTLCLNNPGRRNGLNGKMMNEFSDVLSRLEQWKEGRAVIIHGAEGFFCSGADLTSVKKMANVEGASFISTVMHDNFRRLEELPFVTIAMIQGMALGGGAELTTVCDFRVFTENTKIGFVQSRMGVSPGWGGGMRLIRLVGCEEALKLLLAAKPFGIEEAQRLKYVQHIIPSDLSTEDALKHTAEWFMSNYGNLPAQNSQLLKRLITASKQLPLSDALAVEANIFQQLWGNDYHKQCLSKNIKHK